MVLEFKDKYKIEVFFNENIIKKNAINSFNNILLLDGIEKGIFIDKELAAKIFKKNFDEDIIDIIGTNPLPMSAVYDISKSFRNYDSIQKIIKKIEKIKSVESAVYEKDAIIIFDRMVKNILAFIFFISFLIILVAIFFVSSSFNPVQSLFLGEPNTIRCAPSTLPVWHIAFKYFSISKRDSFVPKTFISVLPNSKACIPTISIPLLAHQFLTLLISLSVAFSGLGKYFPGTISIAST